jgi:DNA invertase Pin-like site-specific DNA recombinase
MEKAYGYIRVSGKSQIEGDGFDRQIKSINDYANANGFEIVHIYQEEGVSGTLQNRPALTDMMLDLEENGHGIHTVIIERIDRLARDLMVQENILYDMGKHGVSILSATDGDLLEDDPTRKLVRQVLGAIAEYDKTMLVLKLKASRDRVKAKTGKCEGRKSYQESNPELLAEIKRLRRKPRNGKRLSLQKTVEVLQEKGFKSDTGKEISLGILKKIIYRVMER